MNHVTAMIVEGVVAILLLFTIGYCMLLNSRLKRLKADEQSLKATIGELITATEIAERAIGGLKHTVRDVNENLGNQIEAATELAAKLGRQIAQSDDVMRRLAQIVTAGQVSSRPIPAPVAAAAPAAVPVPSAARSVAAAAQAFAERRKAGGLAA